MAVDPVDFKEHAERLTGQFGNEITYRCAMSRCYYYVFHYVRENGESHHSVEFNKSAADHKEAKNLLRITGDENLSDDFQKLRRWRNKVDYDLHLDIDELDHKKFERKLESVMARICYISETW